MYISCCAAKNKGGELAREGELRDPTAQAGVGSSGDAVREGDSAKALAEGEWHPARLWGAVP